MKPLEILLASTLLATPMAIDQATAQYLNPQQQTSQGHITFDFAKRNAQYRAKYITQLVEGLELPLNLVQVDYVVHAPSEKIYDSEGAPFMKTEVFKDHGSLKCDILITDDAFKTFANEDEFLSALVDHEFIHAKEHYIYITINAPGEEVRQAEKDINYMIRDDTPSQDRAMLAELIAFDHQIAKFPTRPAIKQDFKEATIKQYNTIVSYVQNHADTPLFKYLKKAYHKRDIPGEKKSKMQRAHGKR